MATLNQAKIINALEALADAPAEDFIYDFLLAYGTPMATINRLKMNDRQRNVASVSGDVAVPQKLYFRAVPQGDSLADALNDILALPMLVQHKIRFVLVTDFATVAAYDRKVQDNTDFDFADLKRNYEFFLPLTGKYEKAIERAEHPADVKACEKMGRLYDSICAVNSYGKDDLHTLNVFLTRLIFCFFAEDTGIFPQGNQMSLAVQSLTLEDGSDLADFFEKLFLALSLPEDAPERKQLPVTFQKFPYVNGDLFLERIHMPQFDKRSRRLILECGGMAWSDISPVIFGSMFQAIMDPDRRRNMGAHYTSEKNILKVVRPLFLDALHEEFAQITELKKGKKAALQAFHAKLGTLGFLDPACGCGNFLVVSYRELRDLELHVLLALQAEDPQSLALNVKLLCKVNINQFYGIEIEEFPVEVARVSLWLMEHVMNVKFGTSLGCVIPSIPLIHSAKIVCANALTTPWESVVPPDKLHYIMGNPPFAGLSSMDKKQKADLLKVFNYRNKAKSLDYVTAWYEKASLYMMNNKIIECSFVSTNSICQGEQVAPLWRTIFERGVVINFAHRTFKWSNEAKGSAGVYCIIVGISHISYKNKKLYIYDDISHEPSMIICDTINAYLSNFKNILVDITSKMLSGNLPMIRGNQPTDGGNLIIEQNELEIFIKNAKQAEPYVRKIYGASEFLYNSPRYCLWLKDAKNEILEIQEVKYRLNKVKNMRLASKAKSTRDYADKPHLFRQITQPDNVPFLLVPRVSSERRRYIPVGFLDKDAIASDAVQFIPNATRYHFGILTSAMHMAWMRTVCGRLKSDYRYSRDLCYNTFPWPNITEQQKHTIEALAQAVLDIRDAHPDKNLAQLYDPDTMPPELQDAHTALDIAVDRLYQTKPFADDEQRLQLLFKLYAELVAKQPKANTAHSNESVYEDDAE